jgi:GNAT superfamily N-acetyltransferase
MGTSAECGDFRQMRGDTPYSSGIEVRPTTPADAAEICDLLEHGFGMTADDWRPLYTTNWLPDNPRGFVVTDGGRIVGHCGTIYSQREINGKTGIVCNFSGFYVAPAYRGRGLGATLVAAAVRDERITYTSLTPAPVTQLVLEAMGFAILERHLLLFPPELNAETLWRSRVDIDVNDPTARPIWWSSGVGAVCGRPGFRCPRYCFAARRTSLRATSNESSWRSCGNRRPSALR